MQVWPIQSERSERRAREKANRISALRARDGDDCYYCSRPLNFDFAGAHVSGSLLPDYPTLDHVVPRARGGSGEISNLVLSCPRCNNEKDNKPAHAMLVQLHGSSSKRA